jgi:hypothetical protein
MIDEISIYTFNNANYILLDKIDHYLYLSNENNPHDMMIRKEDPEDSSMLLPLADEEEFQKALLLLLKKQQSFKEN